MEIGICKEIFHAIFQMPNIGKYKPEKTPLLETFHVVVYELKM